MFWNKTEKRSISYPTDFGFDWSTWLSGGDMNDSVLNDNGYFTALSILSNTVAKLPILVKQNTDKGEIEAINHYLWEMLTLRPNTNMSSYDMKKSLVAQSKHYGVSGLYIDRDSGGKAIGLYPCRITQITIDNAGLIASNKQNKILIDFICCNTQGSCFDSDIIILKDNSINGITSKSTKTYMDSTISSNLSALDYQKELFSNGLTSKIVVQLSSDVKEEKEMTKMQEKFKRLYSSDGRIFTVPVGYNVQPISLDLQSSQFAELRKLGKQDIATAMGVPFNLLETGNLGANENVAFLTNTIQPILTQIEEELNYKLLTSTERKQGYKIRFDVNAMLRVNPTEQSVILDRYVKDGIYTINDCKRVLNLPLVENGDIVTLPSGQITLDQLIKGQASWQTNSSNADG